MPIKSSFLRYAESIVNVKMHLGQFKHHRFPFSPSALKFLLHDEKYLKYFFVLSGAEGLPENIFAILIS